MLLAMRMATGVGNTMMMMMLRMASLGLATLRLMSWLCDAAGVGYAGWLTRCPASMPILDVWV